MSASAVQLLTAFSYNSRPGGQLALNNWPIKI